MESAFDLLKRLSELRNDIHDSTRKITSMLETIEEERSIFPTEPITKHPIRYHRSYYHHHNHNTRKSIENDLKRKNEENLKTKDEHENESGINQKKARCR